MVTFLWLQALLCEQVMHPAQTIALELPKSPNNCLQLVTTVCVARWLPALNADLLEMKIRIK